jgi:hypothetical protein
VEAILVTDEPRSMKPRMGHYLYAHRAVPRAFLREPAAIMGILASDDGMEFLSGMWDVLAREIEEKERVSPEGLALEHYTFEGDVFVALVVMPPPTGGLEAWYVAAVARLEGEDAFARCFTLDRVPEHDPDAAILEWNSEGKYEIRADACPVTREAFLDAVEEICRGTAGDQA